MTKQYSMKKLHFFALACFVLFATTQAYAKPVHITVHPQGARVTEEISVAASQNPTLVRIPLPAGIDSQSIHAWPKENSGVSILSMRLQQVAAPVPQALEALEKQLEAEHITYQELLARIQARSAQIDFWENLKPENLQDAQGNISTLDAAVANVYTKLETLLIEQAKDEVALGKQLEHVGVLEQQIENAGGIPALAPELVLEIAAEKAGNINLVYAYSVQQAGWTPYFSLSAMPESKNVHFRVDATLYQQSGLDWHNVPLTLSTANLSSSPSPRSISPWILMPMTEQMPMPMQVRNRSAIAKNEVMDDIQMEEMSFATAAAPAPPQYDEGKGVSTWQVQSATIPSGPESRIFLAEENISATFVYISRPMLNSSVYLSAMLEKAPASYPAGKAEFFLENEPMGKASLDVAGIQNKPLFFGRDPAITSRYTMPVSQSGQSGIFDKVQSHTWEYTITIDNTHSFPISVRVEDALPESRDERIKLTLNSTPPFEKEDNILFWLLNIPAGQSAAIQHRVSATAPADMTLLTGR